MKIPIVFLGTGQAIPTSRRNHSAVLLSYKDETILIDCGEGTQRQFRKLKLNPCKLTKILITHWHGDHVLGLPGLLQTLMLNKYNKTLEVYGPKGTEKFLGLILSLFVKVGKLNIKVNEVSEGKIIDTQDFYIESARMSHGAECLAYSFIEKDKLRIDKEKLKKFKLKGKPIGELAKGKDIIWQDKKIKAKDLTYKQKGRKITFILDTSVNKNAENLAENSDLLVCESTYLENSENGKNLAKEYKHLTAKQAAEIARKANCKKLILTHLSQRYENKEKLLLQEARKIFKNTEIAEDFLKIEI